MLHAIVEDRARGKACALHTKADGGLRHAEACALRTARYDRVASAAFTRSAVNGSCRSRAPVASKTALPIAAAVTVIDVSPAPIAAASGRLISTVSTTGTSVAQEPRAIVGPPVDRGDAVGAPGHLFAERAAHSVNEAAFNLVRQPVGI